MKNILVTGGAGFIGSNFIIHLFRNEQIKIINLDKLTYAGNLGNLIGLKGSDRHTLIHGEIGNQKLVVDLMNRYRPDTVVNLAAESHVDRSILTPSDFIQTNIMGTFTLLEAALSYYRSVAHPDFRFLHVSTDEVYGSLGPGDAAFEETTAYAPNSPYAASKASSDHLARSYFHTYGLPVLITNCSNNFGQHQFPEKMIPLMILNALEGRHLPVYGDGQNIRDWLYVQDHVEALQIVMERGRPGETYNIGGNCEKSNLEVIRTICHILDERFPDSPHCPHEKLITFVKDRPGHDRRYAINCGKIKRELGWQPKSDFNDRLHQTIEWYIGNPHWVKSIQTGEYRNWMERNYFNRDPGAIA